MTFIYILMLVLIQENAFESVVCEMAVMLSRPQCVKPLLKLGMDV